VVSESNGEISCSIEESNRIRAILGLKPLKMDDGKTSAEAQAVQNFKAKAEEDKRKLNMQEASARIEKARNKRLLHSKLAGQVLSDTAEEEAALASASNWVQRSRLKAEERAKVQGEGTAADKDKKEINQAEYGARDLRGVEVMHGQDTFETGESVILTLADSNILDTDERGNVLGVNMDNDVLENVNMTEEERRQDREKRKKRSRQPVYAGYDDAEFEEGAVPGSRPKLLAQYDEEEKRGPRLKLGEGGVAEGTSCPEQDMLDGKVLPQSLKVVPTSSSLLADYLTPAEYASFSKPKKDKVKKKRKIRKKDSSGLIEELEAALEVEPTTIVRKDRGSRQTGGQSTLSRLEAQENERRDAYTNAVKAASAKKSASSSSSLTSVAVSSAHSSVAEMKEEVEEDDDDADMVQSLARARRLALQSTGKSKTSASSDNLLQLIQRSEQAGQIYKDDASKEGAVKFSQGDQEGDGDDFVNAEGRRRDGTLVFTSTTEFTTRLQARLQEKARSKSAAVIKEMERAGAGGDSDEEGEGEGEGRPQVVRGEARSKDGGWVEVEDASDDENAMVGTHLQQEYGESKGGDRMDVQTEEQQDEEGFGAQPVVAQGMAATLALLKGTGDLTKKKELAGRAKDARGQDPSARDFGVKLDYRDEFGRKMTQKEAFRQISYRFHGIEPGAKKKAKRLQEYQDELRASSSKGKTENTGTMLSLTRAQAATGKAHITVQGGAASSAADIAAAVAQRVKNKADRAKKT